MDGRPLVIAGVACAYDDGAKSPEELLDRYRVPNGWWDALAAEGATVVVVQRFRRSGVLRRNGVEFRFVADGGPASPPFWFSSRAVVRATRDLAADAVHVDGLVFPALIRHLRVALPTSTAIVVQDHGGTSELAVARQRLTKRAFFAAGLRAADSFLFTSREQAAPWQRARILARSQPVHEVCEGSTVLGQPSVSSDDMLPGRPAMLWVGRLNANKDPLTVLRGFERACEALPESALTLLFHDDSLLREVVALVEGSPVLRGRVHLRGALPNDALPPLYATADLFVLGSHSEGSGYALIEAMSFGGSPVVTDIPSFRKITDGGRLGALFAVGDAEGLARALVRVAGDSRDRVARRAEVRAHFEASLSWRAIAAKALDVYRDAAAKRAGAVGPRERA